jgi:prolipoprotein diacylglyceryltransferase
MEIIIIFFYLIILAIGILGTIFWIWMIVDCAQNEPSDQGNDKVIWILVIILAGLIGAAIYYFVRRPERMKKFGK